MVNFQAAALLLLSACSFAHGGKHTGRSTEKLCRQPPEGDRRKLGPGDDDHSSIDRNAVTPDGAEFFMDVYSEKSDIVASMG